MFDLPSQDITDPSLQAQRELASSREGDETGGKVRVLLIAEAANPEWTSVPLVGWSLSRALMEVADVTLVTQVRNRDAIVRAGLVEGADFHTIDNEYIAKAVYRLGQLLGARNGKGWTIGTALSTLSYYEFERLVWRRFSKEIQSGRWDVVHRITPLTPTTPSLIAARCARVGIPFVAGPLNGGVPWPPQFRQAQHAEREWLSYVRDLYKLLPGYRGMRRHAAVLIFGSRDSYNLEPDWVQIKSKYLPENAVDLQRFSLVRAQDWNAVPLRVCFVGRLVPYKGVDMLIEAVLDLAQKGLIHLDIIGDGPMMHSLKLQAQHCDSIVFHGWVPHTELETVMAGSHIFGFPSIREFGGGAVLEAMALGLVPIVIDYAGPSELVDDDCGFKIPLGNRDHIVNCFRSLLDRLVQPGIKEELIRRSVEARRRVLSEYTWEVKVARILNIYGQITRGGGRHL